MEPLSTNEIQKMLQELQNKDDERRIEAVYALGDLNSHNDQVINALKSVATQDQNPEIRQAATNTLRQSSKAHLGRTLSKYSFILAFVGWYVFNTLLVLPFSGAGESILSLLILVGFFLNIGALIFFIFPGRQLIPGILAAILCNSLFLILFADTFHILIFWVPFYQVLFYLVG